MPENTPRPFLGQVADDLKVKTTSSIIAKFVFVVLGFMTKLATDTIATPPPPPPAIQGAESGVERVLGALMECIKDKLSPEQTLARLQRVNEETGFPIKDPNILVALSRAKLAHGIAEGSGKRVLVQMIAIGKELGLPLQDDDLVKFADEIEKRL